MKATLDHLPEVKQRQILQVTDIIREVVAPEKIILFGSYATGSWVEDRYAEDGVMYEYLSDYDFLVITKDSKEKDYLLTDKIVNRSTDLFRTPVNTIIHDIKYVNEGLEVGQYFFTDIVKEGVLLYDTKAAEFAVPREVSSTEAKQIAERYFVKWFASAEEFLKLAPNTFESKNLNIGAFLLHQAAEHFYNTVLLVFTGYKPKTHSLAKLRKYVKLYSKEVFGIFPDPAPDKYSEHLFDLLKRGYIDARYKFDYDITEEELLALVGKLKEMQDVVDAVCKQKIETFIQE